MTPTLGGCHDTEQEGERVNQPVNGGRSHPGRRGYVLAGWR